jgi:hypothetical protein
MDDAVAGNEDGNGVLLNSCCDVAHSLRLSDALCHLLVSYGGTERNLPELVPHFQLKVGAFEVEWHRMVQAFEDDLLYGLCHGVALRRGRVFAPPHRQFMDRLQTVIVEKLQVAYAIPRACHDDAAERTLGKSELNFVAYCHVEFMFSANVIISP